MRKSLKKVIDPTIKILEDYFNPKSIYFLGTPKTMEDWDHTCAKSVISKMKYRESIGQTKKAKRNH